jgi:hypothetical protein
VRRHQPRRQDLRLRRLRRREPRLQVDCTFDFSSCTAPLTCGDGDLDGAEQCDGNNLDGKTCQSLGFASGSLACNANCSLNTSACVPIAVEPETTTPPATTASTTTKTA